MACSGDIVDIYEKNECFAVAELMARDPLRSSFHAAKKSTVGGVPKAAFEGMLVKFPEASVTLSRYLATKERRRDVRTSGDERGSDLAGGLEIPALPALEQAINLRLTTCLMILRETDARIVLVFGQGVAARHRGREGLEAFFSILEKRPRTFKLVAKPREIERNVHTSTMLLLLEAAKRVDEASALTR